MKRELAKLVANGFSKEAVFLYAQHHSASRRAHGFTFPPLFKACAEQDSNSQGQMLHTQMIKTGFQSDVYAATALTSMYMKLHCLGDALKAFEEMPERNVASLNVVISGFSQNGLCREAFSVFKNVSFWKLRPNSLTMACLLSACEAVDHGTEIHCWVIKLGVEHDVYVATSLLTMYSNCGELGLTSKVFEEMSEKNVVSYNAFISGLVQNGKPSSVLNIFKQMRECSGYEANSVTFASVFSACSSLLNLQFGRQVHGLTEKNQMRNVMVGTSLVDMYSKCGSWQCAYNVFKELNGIRNIFIWNSIISGMMLNAQCEIAVKIFELLDSEQLEPDTVTWNSIISGFSKLGKANEAFSYFHRMQSTGMVPSLKSLTSLLDACSDLCAVNCGKEIHGHVIKTVIGIDEFFATALIDMYMKCGNSCWARKVFDQFDIKPDDPAFWNAMISGYGLNGESKSGFEIFYQMLEEKVRPNATTFAVVLSMCSHNGLVEKAWEIFKMMNEEYDLQPKTVHYSCMVDLLGRSGQLEKARQLLQEIPGPSSSIFASLLGACGCHLDPELGEKMALKISELEPENPTPYVILSNMYAGMGRWKDVERIRDIMNNKGLKKLPGSSLVGMT